MPPKPICNHTGIPILFCAHCQQGWPSKQDDPSHGFRGDKASIGSLGSSSSVARKGAAATISSRWGPSMGALGVRPTSQWARDQQMRTFLSLVGLKPGGMDDPDDKEMAVRYPDRLNSQ